MDVLKCHVTKEFELKHTIQIEPLLTLSKSHTLTHRRFHHLNYRVAFIVEVVLHGWFYFRSDNQNNTDISGLV